LRSHGLVDILPAGTPPQPSSHLAASRAALVGRQLPPPSRTRPNVVALILTVANRPSSRLAAVATPRRQPVENSGGLSHVSFAKTGTGVTIRASWFASGRTRRRDFLANGLRSVPPPRVRARSPSSGHARRIDRSVTSTHSPRPENRTSCPIHLCSATFVPMMKAADFGHCHDVADRHVGSRTMTGASFLRARCVRLRW
jgi:hypothetical protein